MGVCNVVSSQGCAVLPRGDLERARSQLSTLRGKVSRTVLMISWTLLFTSWDSEALDEIACSINVPMSEIPASGMSVSCDRSNCFSVSLRVIICHEVVVFHTFLIQMLTTSIFCQS